MNLRSTSSAEKNFPDEITWITWKTKQNLEIWPFLNSPLEKWVWAGGPKIDPATGVISLECFFDAPPEPSLEKREKHSKRAKKDAALEPSLALSLALSFDAAPETFLVL